MAHGMDRSTLLSSTYLVIDICDVHDKVQLEAKVVHENAPDDIGRDIVARMAQVALVVHGRTAGVPGDLAGLNWLEGHRRSRLEGAVNLERLHGGGEARI